MARAATAGAHGLGCRVNCSCGHGPRPWPRQSWLPPVVFAAELPAHRRFLPWLHSRRYQAAASKTASGTGQPEDREPERFKIFAAVARLLISEWRFRMERGLLFTRLLLKDDGTIKLVNVNRTVRALS